MHPVFRAEAPDAGAHLPSSLSYSSLSELELCPRRWWLLHSHYEVLQRAYPQPVFAATVMGSVVHGALRAFAERLRAAGNPAPGSPEFAAVRQSFLLRDTVRRLRHEEINKHADNPRVDTAALGAAVSVDACITAFKRLVRHAYAGDSTAGGVEATGTREGEEPILSVEMGSASASAPAGTWSVEHANAATQPDAGRGAEIGTERWTSSDQVPCPAVLPEVQVEVSDPPLRGSIDLVLTAPEGDTIVEYKTGEPRTEHEGQSRIYAVLWWRWTSRPIQRRLLVYADHEPVLLGGLSSADLEREEAALRARVETVCADLRHVPPTARPAADTCAFCPVRQLCPEYWVSPATADARWTRDRIERLVSDADRAVIDWRDLELDLRHAEEAGGGFSVVVSFSADDGSTDRDAIRLLCSVPVKFHPGALRAVRRARLLGVGLKRDGGALHVVWSRNSEAFWSH